MIVILYIEACILLICRKTPIRKLLSDDLALEINSCFSKMQWIKHFNPLSMLFLWQQLIFTG